MHLYIGYNLNSNLTFVVQLDSLNFIEIQSNSSGFIFLVNPIILAFVMLCLIVTPEGTAFAITTATEYETGYEIEFSWTSSGELVLRRTRIMGSYFPNFEYFPNHLHCVLCILHVLRHVFLFCLKVSEQFAKRHWTNKKYWF